MSRALLFLALMATAAQAQTIVRPQPPMPCSPRDEIAKMLLDKFSEVPVAAGIFGANQIRIYLYPKDGSWTIAEIDGQGMSCIVRSGKDFGPVSDAKPGSGT